MSDQASGPEKGQDSSVDDWYGQSVQRDSELADELSADLDPEDAEATFDEQSEGKKEQDRRHGSEIDPDQGVDASHRSS